MRKTTPDPSTTARQGRRALTTLVLALTTGLVALPVDAQRQQLRRAGEPGPAIASLEIHVEDMASREIIAKLNPRETLEVEVGQRLRLRMVGLPAGQARAPRYPSTRFYMEKSSRQVQVERANQEVGSIIVRAAREHTGPGAAPILFEITDAVRMPERELTGRVYLKVVPARTRIVPDESTDQPREELRGITLYEDAGFQGRNETFYGDRNDLRGTIIGNDRATSIRVDPGCEAVLYEDTEYRGRSIVVRGDAPALSDLGIGNDRVSSLRVDCSDRRRERGVTLYEGVDFTGDSELFTGDDPGLGDNLIGNDRARSVQVDPGCRATLYRDGNFRGRSTSVDRDLLTLSGTEVGNDAVTSIRVECDRRRR